MIRRRKNERELIGQRFHKLRLALRRTKVGMASLMGVNRSTYTRYENGLLFPGFDPLHILVHQCGVSTDWLIFGKGTMFNKKNTNPNARALENLPEDVVELIQHMKGIPILRHQMMIHFHEFKQKNPELVEEFLK